MVAGLGVPIFRVITVFNYIPIAWHSSASRKEIKALPPVNYHKRYLD